MHVFYTPDIASNLELPEEEAGHCLRVLRLSIGDVDRWERLFLQSCNQCCKR